MLLCEYIESVYLTWKSEQHSLKLKYDILRSLVTLVEHYFVTMEEDDTLFKITYQIFNGFVTFKGRSGELIYITFLHARLYTLVPYPEELDPEIFYFK